MESDLDFSVCLNPLGTPASVKSALTEAIQDFSGLPDAHFSRLRGAFAGRHGASVAQVAVGDHEEELIELLAESALSVKRALVPEPCPPSYLRALKAAGISVNPLELHLRYDLRLQYDELHRELDGCQMLLLGNPAWPASALVDRDQMTAAIGDFLKDGGWLIVDERGIDFTYGSVANSLWPSLRHEPHAAVIRSLTGLLALPLCPVCYAVGGAAWVTAARERQFSPPLSPLADFLAPALTGLTEFRGRTVEYTAHTMGLFTGRLRRITGLRPLPYDANWVLCRLERRDFTVAELAITLRQQGLIIRPIVDGSYFMLGMRVPLESNRLIRAIRSVAMPRRKKSSKS